MFKGQSSVEFLTVVGIGFVIAAPFIVGVQDSMISVVQESDTAGFEASLNSMADAVDRADALGESARTEFNLELPNGVEGAQITSDGKAVIYTVSRPAGSTNYTRIFDTEISGDLPEERGRYQGIAHRGEDYVEIEFDNWDPEILDVYFDPSITADNDPIEQGETLQASFEVENTGEETGEQEIVVTVKNSSGFSEQIFNELHEIEPSDSLEEVVTWDSTGSAPGSYFLELETSNDTATDDFTVMEEEEAYFQVSIDESETDDTVEQGETFNANYTVENTGDATDTQDISYNITRNGEEAQSEDNHLQDLELGESSTEESSIEWVVESAEAGEYLLNVSSEDDYDTFQFNVEEKEELTEYGELVLADNPQGYWKLDETSGTTAVDQTDNNHDGTIEGSPDMGVEGADGTAISFDGDGEYVNLEGYAGVTGSSTRTVEAWVKPGEGVDYTDSENTHVVDWGGTDAGERYSVRISDEGAGDPVLRVEVEGGFKYGETQLERGKWNHIAVVLPEGSNDVTDHVLYVNGQEDGTGDEGSQTVNTADETMFISRSPHQERDFIGAVDEVAIYDTELSAQDIEERYTALMGEIPQEGLQIHLDATQISASDGDTVQNWDDLSGNNNDASSPDASSSPSLTESGINDVQALEFDGSSSIMTIPHSPELDMDDFTVFTVFQASSSTLTDEIGTITNKQGSDTYGDRNWWIAIDNDQGFAGGNGAIGLRTSSGGEVVSVEADDKNYIDDQPYLLETSVDSTSDEASIRLEAEEKDSATEVGQPEGVGEPVGIGAEIEGSTSSGFSRYFGGEIGEIIIYNRTLSTEERDKIEAYIDEKWGLGESEPETLRTGDYASEDGSSNWWWRGYEFTPEEDIEVTHLLGGFTESGGHLGLYRSDGSEVAQELLAHIEDPTGRATEHDLAEPVQLGSSEHYIIAQGALSSTPDHYEITSIDVSGLESEHVVTSWKPSDGDTMRWSDGGDETYILNNAPQDSSWDSARPDIGFVYTLTE